MLLHRACQLQHFYVPVILIYTTAVMVQCPYLMRELIFLSKQTIQIQEVHSPLVLSIRSDSLLIFANSRIPILSIWCMVSIRGFTTVKLPTMWRIPCLWLRFLQGTQKPLVIEAV